MHRVVVAALLRDPGEVLLCFRSAHRQAHPAVWDFPGGHVEADETPREALRRELLEEVGVRLHTAALTDDGDLRWTDGDVELSLWAVRSWDGEPANRAPEEHDEVRWFGLDDALTLPLAHAQCRAWLASLPEARG